MSSVRSVVALVVIALVVVATGSGCAAPEPESASQTESATATGQGGAGAAGAGGAGSGGASAGGSDDPFSGCAEDSAAAQNVEALWSVFDQHYALFDIRLPDRSWDSVGHEACAALPASDDAALFELLLDMGRALDDGHVQLEAPALGLEGDGWVTVYPHLDVVDELELNVEANYLAGELSWAADDWFGWGLIGDVGYLSITSFDELSETGDEDDDVDAAMAAMDQALGDLGFTSGMIVDVRANGGGWDAVSLAVAARFAGPETLAWSETTRAGPAHDDFGPWQDVFVAAAPGDAYAGDVVLLTSGATFSAAETFALAMRVRDHVTIVGEPSSGHFSDLFDAELPNGWSLGFSGERYRAADGTIYETLGVPVDLAAPFDPTAFAAGQDIMLEAALQALGAP